MGIKFLSIPDQPGIAYPLCHRCGRTTLVDAEYELDGNKDYDAYIGDIPQSLKGKKWLWKGMACFECEHMDGGTWKPVEESSEIILTPMKE